MLVILSGVAGAGKDTVKNELLKRMEQVVTIPSYTDRPMRKGDIPGQTYNFITTEEFKEKIQNGELYEYDVHHNNYYGTSKKILDDKVKEGKIIIKDIDVNGTEELLKIFKGKVKIVTIFLRVNREELKRRLTNRIDKPDEAEVNLRLQRFDYEESKMEKYDYIVENIDIEKTMSQVIQIVEKEYNK